MQRWRWGAEGCEDRVAGAILLCLRNLFSVVFCVFFSVLLAFLIISLPKTWCIFYGVVGENTVKGEVYPGWRGEVVVSFPRL